MPEPGSGRRHRSRRRLIPGKTPDIRRRRRRDLLVILGFCVLSALAVYLLLWSPMRM